VTVLRDGESVGTHPVSEINEVSLIKLMVGREIPSPLTQPSPPAAAGEGRLLSPGAPGVRGAEYATGAPVLSLRAVGCRAAGVHDVTLEARAGEVLGLAGLVGAGRTELARVLFGITPADSGSMLMGGKPVEIRSPREAVEAGIGYLPEDRRRHGVILEMTVAANITLGILSRLFPASWLRFGAERQLAEGLCRDLAVKTPSVESPVSSLSGGNQQKVALARWLATTPKLLILDEPTQGVDVGAKAEIHRIIRRLAASGLAVLMISSDLPEILGMSDRIAVMRGGTSIAMFDGSRATAHDVMAAALGQPNGQGAA
jgi:rhamnose transport system ATP-binding protein